MVGVQIVVGLDRNLFFQIILLFFEKFINIPLNGRGNLVFKVLDGVQTVVCQMIQSTVVCRFHAEQSGMFHFSECFLKLKISCVFFFQNKFGNL